MNWMDEIQKTGKTTAFAPKTRKNANQILSVIKPKRPIIYFVLHVQRLTGLRHSDCTRITLADIGMSPNSIPTEIIVHQKKVFSGAMTRVNQHPEYSKWSIKKKRQYASRKSLLRVYISQTLREALVELYGYQCDNNPNFNARSGKSFIFANTHHHSKGKPITKDGINQYLKSDALRIELEKLGISNANLSTHSFRKEFGQHLLEEGADVKQIQELLGQSSLEATIRYLSTDDSDKRDLVEMLGRQAAGVNEPVVASGANDELDSAESVNSRILALVERAVMSGADGSVVEALLKGIKSRL